MSAKEPIKNVVNTALGNLTQNNTLKVSMKIKRKGLRLIIDGLNIREQQLDHILK